ncbi:glycosyl transferase, partial [Streptomyces nanshensis]
PFGGRGGAPFGGRGGGPFGGRGGGPFGGSGIDRMFSETAGGQISWLLPAALILLVAGLVVTRKASRTDVQRAALVAWGGSLLVTGVVFSLMSGIFHEYYTVALAPYIAAVVAIGAVLLWRNRTQRAASIALAATVAVTAVWSYVLLGRAGDWLPWLKWAVVAAGLLAAVGLLVTTVLPRRGVRAVAVLALAAVLAGPVAWTVSTVRTPHTGAIVTAGPAVQGAGFGGR